MEPEKFILEIIETYRRARIPLFANKKIRRGRSRPISSIAEDLFANYLILNDSTIDTILVDQSIFFMETKQTIYPDIAIIRDGTIFAFIDLKMDIGWKRKELVNLCKKHSETIAKSRGRNARIKDGQTKEIEVLKVSGDVSYSIVIISRRNSGNTLDSLRQESMKFKPLVETFLLCDSPSYHPNEYTFDPKSLVEKLHVNSNAFKMLLKRLAR